MKWVDDEPAEYEIYADAFRALVLCMVGIVGFAAAITAVIVWEVLK
jgi:hypothetical protein